MLVPRDGLFIVVRRSWILCWAGPREPAGNHHLLNRKPNGVRPASWLV